MIGACWRTRARGWTSSKREGRFPNRVFAHLRLIVVLLVDVPEIDQNIPVLLLVELCRRAEPQTEARRDERTPKRAMQVAAQSSASSERRKVPTLASRKTLGTCSGHNRSSSAIIALPLATSRRRFAPATLPSAAHSFRVKPETATLDDERAC